MKTITRIDLERDLRNADVQPGDTLVVHSSLSRVGWILGGPLEVLRALRNVLGPTGTLVMPTFTFNLVAWGMPTFNPQETPSRVGVLTDALWRQSDALRSMHPTHSVAAAGPLAKEIIGDRINYEPLGIDSPLDRARKFGAKILLLGVAQNRNSTVHVAESYADVPYFAVHFAPHGTYDEAWYLTPKMRRELVIVEQMPGSSEGFDVLEEPLRRLGVCRDVMIGHAESQIMNADRLLSVVTDMLRANPLLLLAPDSTSEITQRRLEHTRAVLLDRRPALHPIPSCEGTFS